MKYTLLCGEREIDYPELRLPSHLVFATRGCVLVAEK